MAVIPISATRNEIPIHHAGSIHVNAPADFEIEFAFGHRGHATSLDAPRIRGNLDSVAYRRDGFVRGKELLRKAHEIGVVTDVFRGATAGIHDPEILCF